MTIIEKILSDKVINFTAIFNEIEKLPINEQIELLTVILSRYPSTIEYNKQIESGISRDSFINTRKKMYSM